MYEVYVVYEAFGTAGSAGSVALLYILYIYVGMYCLYPNLENKRAFVASWNEQGEHDPGDMKVCDMYLCVCVCVCGYIYCMCVNMCIF